MAAGKDSSWDDIKNEGIDLVSIFFSILALRSRYLLYHANFFLTEQEKIPIEEVFTQLRCTREGLTSDEGHTRLEIFGPNKLEEKKANTLNKPFFILFVSSLRRKPSF